MTENPHSSVFLIRPVVPVFLFFILLALLIAVRYVYYLYSNIMEMERPSKGWLMFSDSKSEGETFLADLLLYFTLSFSVKSFMKLVCFYNVFIWMMSEAFTWGCSWSCFSWQTDSRTALHLNIREPQPNSVSLHPTYSCQTLKICLSEIAISLKCLLKPPCGKVTA